MNLYTISKAWFEYKAENQNLTGNHTEFLFYVLDLNNRLAWKEVFGLPAIETSQFLNISYNTFRKILSDFIELDLIKLVKKSKNQYTANQISIAPLCQILLKQKKSTYKAFIKAQQKQLIKQSDIDRHINIKTLRQEDINDIFENKDFLKELKKRGYEKKEEPLKDKLFDVFWDSYHSISEKKRTDKEATLKYWNKLTKEEKQKAIDKIKPYCNSVTEKKYIKKARTYLADKNFNDEFAAQKKADKYSNFKNTNGDYSQIEIKNWK